MNRKAHPRTPVVHQASGTLLSAAVVRPEVSDPYIGTTFGHRYEIVAQIAEGSQGRVYVARHLLIERMVAIKVLFLTLASEQGLVSRFLNEGRAAGSLGHPNIVECLDMGYAGDGAPYLVMERLAGQTLAAAIDTLGPFLHGRAAYIATQIASALGAAHDRAIVHRDLKPENVFLVDHATRPDHVKVLDFGISKFSSEGSRVQTSKGQFLGTPGFMAPEQIDDPASVDARADVYALGATLYHMLAGEPPFANVDFPKVLRCICEEEPRPLAEARPDLPPSVVAIVERAMAKSRDDRFQTMADFEEALTPHALEPMRRRAMASAPSDARLAALPTSHPSHPSHPSAPSLSSRPSFEAADSHGATIADGGSPAAAGAPASRRRWIAGGALLLGAAAIAAVVAIRPRREGAPGADAAKETAAAAAIAAPPTGPAPAKNGGAAQPLARLEAAQPARGDTANPADDIGAVQPTSAVMDGAARGGPTRAPLGPRPKGGAAARPADPRAAGSVLPGAPPSTPAPAADGTPSAAPSCSPPFYFDGRKKIFKPECI